MRYDRVSNYLNKCYFFHKISFSFTKRMDGILLRGEQLIKFLFCLVQQVVSFLVYSTLLKLTP